MKGGFPQKLCMISAVTWTSLITIMINGFLAIEIDLSMFCYHGIFSMESDD